MELNLQQRRKALNEKIPDIENTLRMVKFLQVRSKRALGEPVEEEPAANGSEDEDDDLDDVLDDDDDDAQAEDKANAPLKTLFELNSTLYAEAEVEETGEVGIWLGVSPTSVCLPKTCSCQNKPL